MTTESGELDAFRLLQWLSSEINASLDLDEILGTVLRAMDELFGFHHSLILLLDERGETLTVVASRGYENATIGARVPAGKGLIGVAAKKRKIVRVSNLAQKRGYFATIRLRMEAAGRGDELEGFPELPGLENAQSQIAIPLMIKDELIGVFSVESLEQRGIGEREESLITIVANHAASSIHNARLYRLEAEQRVRLKELTEHLEERVEERTRELERKNRELRDTQTQLLQSAKLASLADLVAGVSHEINTPLGSISASADLAERAVKLVREATETLPSTHPKLPKALDALSDASRTSRLACERIVQMVKSLRQFARLDEAERKRANLHQGIDATLDLLRHRMGPGIEIVRDYGNVPEILCYPNRLNEVFMNLLVNAAQAMGDSGRITIRTRLEGREAVLSFENTGPAIPESLLGRIFDPGFTTKGVGVGMGLGLSISYRIVHDHGGRIEASSPPGGGARFKVTLPLASP
jgi:signal transduction histidine kinase